VNPFVYMILPCLVEFEGEQGQVVMVQPYYVAAVRPGAIGSKPTTRIFLVGNANDPIWVRGGTQVVANKLEMAAHLGRGTHSEPKDETPH
jgi:hypothetical protein